MTEPRFIPPDEDLMPYIFEELAFLRHVDILDQAGNAQKLAQALSRALTSLDHLIMFAGSRYELSRPERRQHHLEVLRSGRKLLQEYNYLKSMGKVIIEEEDCKGC